MFFLQMLRSLLLVVCVSYTLAVICYDCYDTGPNHTACTKERNCTGLACMIFDAGNNATSTAFCLLAMRGDENIHQKTGCWLEPDGRGRHCMCYDDFCNRLIPQSEQSQSEQLPIFSSCALVFTKNVSLWIYFLRSHVPTPTRCPISQAQSTSRLSRSS
ncbi:hypothetical protein NECAME_13485 [Necator americanus]|uniref:Protein quiver n=1 Tax=Necator americanus TaxID=51031 RepID=W2SY62_NECAM|nr:hypothetical protein NECAME_13485 [Necator americanus]ETN73547.1 hypothetical protein NECAME_13485 [Necator americanus]